ncbi:MAG TPA: hypothetical protein VD965_04855 [Burkholderiales bacterium]|nr:hypothetical protein [Burkholderiales bacterium]
MALPAAASEPLEPALVMNLSPSGVRALNNEFDEDLRALDAFGGRRKDAWMRSYEAPKHWMLYGRLGLLNFQNEIREQGATGTKFTLRRSGPKLTGKIYVGIHRKF